MEKADKINTLVEKINSHLTAGGSGEFLTREDYEFILGSQERDPDEIAEPCVQRVSVWRESRI